MLYQVVEKINPVYPAVAYPFATAEKTINQDEVIAALLEVAADFNLPITPTATPTGVEFKYGSEKSFSTYKLVEGRVVIFRYNQAPLIIDITEYELFYRQTAEQADQHAIHTEDTLTLLSNKIESLATQLQELQQPATTKSKAKTKSSDTAQTDTSQKDVAE